ncbi:MAG TPA: glycosyltransferase [Saprospiraceae bacterium]|nr:glycosyltransferase [Saprospiraceae bacterium]
MKPKITIITVTYNCEQVIKKTIDSVLSQTYGAIEYIIVDGASKDNTFSLVQAYGSRIHKAISEPDKGLYDAMNKGLSLATGDFVWFVNAGDRIHSEDTVEKMMQFYESDTDVLYGEVMMMDTNGQELGTRSEFTTQKLPKNLHWQSLRRGMVVSHQGFLPRLSITKPYIENNLAADIDWVIEALKKSRKNTFVPLVLADFEIGGTSRQHHQQSLQNRYAVLRKQYGFWPNLWNHGWIVLRAIGYRILGKARY